MAETFLTPVIESLFKLLKEEVKSLKSVHGEAESLKRELEIIQSLLKDADAKEDRRELSEAVSTWVKHLREEADHIEDVIDEYRWHVAQSTTDKHGFVGLLSKIGHRVKALKSRYPITSKIRDINERLRSMKDTGQGYGLSQGLQGSSSKNPYIEEHDARIGSHFVVEDDEYVDVPSIQRELESFLIAGESARAVVSLVGQGGIGKTTLVKKVYDEVKHNFDCHVWLTVSQSYDREKLLRIMMKEIRLIVEFTTSDYDMIQGLITPIRQYLQTKRYAIVFDDVWDTDFWEVMKHALPSNDEGSRIIITTRNASIAASCKETPFDFIQELETWSPKLAWELFCKKTFRHEFKGHCPEELEELSHKIVSKCHGLPLAIGAIAGLLSRKQKVQFEWQCVLDSLNSEFKTNPQLSRISKVLSLSYHDLPYHLKSCLLYFSIFPEDWSIPFKTWCEIWIAEDLIKAREYKTLEEEVKGYLNELLQRNLILLEVYDGVYKRYKVHDLMHEFLLSKASDLCYCQILDGKKSDFSGKHRRLSIHDHSMLQTITKTSNQYSGVRSIFLFNFNDDLINKSSLITLFQNFKLLKLLDFAGAPLDFLPKEVGTLFHLRYLNLLETKIKVLPKSIGKLYNLQVLNLKSTLVCILPKSIGKLHNLQTLNLLYTLVRELPMEINQLRNLRHICASCEDKTFRLRFMGGLIGVKIQKGFGYLENLETLEQVEVHLDEVSFSKELEKLSKLKRLHVTSLTKETVRAICAVVKKLNHLEDLHLAVQDEDEILDLELISSSPPPLMRFIWLYGRLNKFPHWISKLSNLEGLTLILSKLTDNPLKYLKDLPNLISLRLIESYDEDQLHFEEGGFPKLNELLLHTLKGLKLVKIDKGTLPLLKMLDIISCPLLEEVPSGIQYLRNLKRLSIVHMPREFVDRLQSNGGPDYPKIQHVPIVRMK